MNARTTIIVFLCFGLCSSWMDQRPVLESHGGNLIISSAKDRNITLKTLGDGYVTINEINLLHVARAAHDASKLVERWKSGYMSDVEETLRRLSEIIEGPHGLQRRMNSLEWGDGSTNRSRTDEGNSRNEVTRYRFQALSNRVQRLERRIRRIGRKLRTNDCASDPCQNGGTCIDLYDSFLCHCPAEWEGALCTVDVDECKRYAGKPFDCQNGATCVNLPGSYRCTCAPGWHGIHCMTQKSTCDSNDAELCGHGICVKTNTPLGYNCICEQGWTHLEANNPACLQDVDECGTGRYPCSVNPLVACHNVPGSYFCGNCPVGYTGNGYKCQDIDECLVNNGGCSTTPFVECENTMGSRKCGSCPAGYAGDGVTCFYTGSCKSNNGGCHPLATCQESPGSDVLCVCPAGYQGTGKGPNGCQQLANACRNHNCVHGTCHAVNENAYTCTCNPGFTGQTCAARLDPCIPNPCLHNGVCRISSWRNAICNCTAGFTGTRCELTKQACGGFMTSSSGNIDFPTGGVKYNSGHNCAWVLVTNSSMVLNVTFTRFSLEQSDDCKYDYLQIHDGNTAGNAILGRFCGDQLPKGGTIISSHNSLYLWFHSDTTGNHDGFALNWNSTTPVCGGKLVADDGVISSPGSPGNYPPNRDCFWEVQVKPGRRIMFTFFKLEIEDHPTCDYDYLEINETTYAGQNRIGLFCNHTRPQPVTTLGNRVTVHFHSDFSGSDSGFQLSYTTIMSSPDCGGVFTSETGEIVSPGFHSGTYKSDTICEWIIRLPKNNRAKITFLQFNIESSSGCLFDLIQIFEGPDTNSPLVGKYCGSELPEPVVPNSNEILIRFESDGTLESTGFVLKYDVICGGEYTEPLGVISSPYYPNAYPASKDCAYLIVQPPGKAIVLTMQFMDIEKPLKTDNDTSECLFDRLEIRDGDTENSTLLMSICGPSEMMPKEPIISSLNFMYLRFVTDRNINNLGFMANYTTIDRECGGIIKTGPGILDIPEKGKTLTYNMDCIWTIRAPKGHAVQLTWLAFHTSEDSEDCGLDYIEILEDYGTPQNKSMGKYCHTKKPPQILASQGTGMTIHFHSADISNQNFQASYNFIDASKICGGRYYSDTGYIVSPNYPKSYPKNKDCVWIIEASNRHVVELRVKAFKLESHSGCEFDYLEIRSGGYENSPLIGKFCGETIPKEISSMTNQMYIKFESDSSLSDEGFEIEWNSRTSGCGGELTTSSGSFISPNYPQPYHHKAYCTWNIRVSAGSVVHIVFVDLDIEYQDRCTYDYLLIAPVINGYPKNPQRFCGKTAPPLLRLESNMVKAIFRSDILTAARGFHVRYVTECQNKVTGFRGVIESPNFPEEYDNHANCTWIIQVPAGNKINVTFSHFEVEKTDNNCTSDYVQLFEGDSDVANTLIGKYCGNEEDVLPLKITSAQHQVFVRFQTDGSLTYTGFRLEWFVHGCSAHLRTPSGMFSSPGYPQSYAYSDMLVECEWLIEVDRDRSIEVTFMEIEITKKHVCYDTDIVDVYNGGGTSAPKLGELCHSLTPVTFTSTGSQLFVKYSISTYMSGKGFLAKYRSIDLKCGGRFTAQYGTIQSANYPQNYPHSQNCEWLLRVDPDHAINLTFVDFDVEGSRNCSDDYVKVFDGPSRDAPLLGTHCGTVPVLPAYTSSGNTMLVVMRSDVLISAKGFKAEYSRACGARIIVKDQGYLRSSPTLHHQKLSNCSWILVAENPGDKVTLIFNHMDFLTYNDDCSDNRIQVLDGDSADGPVLASLCNTNIPPAIVSSGNALTVHMISTYELTNGDNFIATYSVFTSACGGNYTAENGTFTTPGYPESYPMSAECVWILRTSPGNRVSLNFEDFELIDSENCETDYVEVRDIDGIGYLHGVFCGTSPPSITSSNQLWLKFRSGITTTGTPKGFKASFTFLHGNELSGDFGEIASPLYPSPYRRLNTFTWRVTVDFKWAVRVEFMDFYMDNTGEYCYATLKFYDGYNDEAPLIAEKCGLTKPEPIESTGNAMFIVMTSYYDSVGSWFHLRWLKIPVNVEGNTETELSPCTEVVLLGVANATYELRSPGWPSGYANNLKCSWTFMTPAGTHLSIKFHEMDIEETDDCVTDYVAVYSGAVKTFDSSENLLSKVCAPSVAFSTISAPNVMTVQFYTDSSDNKTGFTATVARECGGNMEGPNGVIEINNATKMAGFRFWGISCEWNVTVRTGRKIAVKVIELDIDNPQKSADKSCVHNFLMLKNGESASSPLLGQGKYCSDAAPLYLNTTGNHLYVKLNLSRRNVHFKLSYREIGSDCGGRYVISSKSGEPEVTISTPNYPNIPSPHTECVWIFFAPEGKRLGIHFIERFDLLYSRNCEKEYVEIKDGGTEMARSLGTFCKDEAPSSITTEGNMMYVHYFTDATEPRNGFKALVQADFCGGIIRDRRGAISSPNYPLPYPENGNRCGWWIIGPSDHGLKLQFEDINLPQNKNCSTGDFVSISEKRPSNLSGSLMGSYCGRVNPGVIDVLTNEAFVYFITNKADKGIPYKGFRLNFTSNREMCGSALSGMSGTFKTTGYPRESQYRYCSWRITVPLGFRVVVEFLDFDLGGDLFSNTGQASFAHDSSSIATIKRARNIGPNERIMSSSNFMLIYYYSTVGHRGVHGKFRAVAPAACGEELTDAEGTLTNPTMYNNASYYCKWTLNPPEELAATSEQTGLTLAVKTTGFINRERISLYCPYFLGYVSIKSERRRVARICGNLTVEPAYVRAPFKSYVIEAVNGTYGNPVNFKLEYKWHQCGGILKGPSNIITAPKNLTYPIECAWSAQYPDDEETISLTFTRMNLGPCHKSFVLIRNGNNRSPEIGKFCGNVKLGNLTSSGHRLWIEYYASEGPGDFEIRLESRGFSCGGIITNNRKEFRSPGFPGLYPSNTECAWELLASEGYHIGLTFVERFNLETSPNCTNDFVQIFDRQTNENNGDEEWRDLGKVCGRVPPKSFNTTSNRMKVLFRSNDQMEADGFRAVWNVNCGGSFNVTKSPKYLTSPRYPHSYDGSLYCNYTLYAPPGKEIIVEFKDFNLEASDGCQYDNLTISLFDDNTRITEGTWCGVDKPPLRRSVSRMELVFRSDRSVTRRGFQFKYSLNDCGGYISEPQIINPVLRSADYYGSLNCTWVVVAPQKKNVQLKFEEFILPSRIGCRYESVAIYEGTFINSAKTKGKFCGNLTSSLPNIKSTGNAMTISFVINYGLENNVLFKAAILFLNGPENGCGGEINLRGSKDFKTQLQARYPPLEECHWMVYAELGHTITLSINEMDLKGNSNDTKNGTCTADYLEVRDGGPFAELIGRYCGNVLPPPITSSLNRMWIRFVTDGLGDGRGAKGTLTSFPSICGPSTLTVRNSSEPSQRQFLTSPNYPRPYPTEITCRWVISSKERRDKIYVTFNDFDLEDSERCDTEYLKITDLRVREYIDEGFGEQLVIGGNLWRSHNLIVASRMPMAPYTYCGKISPHDYYSGGKDIEIKYKSVGNQQHKGFKLSYGLLGCSRNFTSPQGRIFHEKFKECWVTIEVPENFTISLYFSNIGFPGRSNCENGRLEVRDGLDFNGNILTTACGYATPSPVFSTGNKLSLHSFDRSTGFLRNYYDITYTSSDQGRGCGGKLFNYGGVFTSPFYPEPYRNDSQCSWEISVPTGLKISLQFSDFNIGPKATCNNVYVSFFNVKPDGEKEHFITHCGGETPATFQSPGNVVSVLYSSSVNNGGSGWVIHFSASSGDRYSPNGHDRLYSRTLKDFMIL